MATTISPMLVSDRELLPEAGSMGTASFMGYLVHSKRGQLHDYYMCTS